MTRDYAAVYRQALEDAVKVVRRFLSFDSQRAVSWHEVNDAIAAIRALPVPAEVAACKTCGGSGDVEQKDHGYGPTWSPCHDCTEPTPAEAPCGTCGRILSERCVEPGRICPDCSTPPAEAPVADRRHCDTCGEMRWCMEDAGGITWSCDECRVTSDALSINLDSEASRPGAHVLGSMASAPPRAEGERKEMRCLGCRERAFAVGPLLNGLCGECQKECDE